MSPSSSRAGGQRLRRLLALTAVAAAAAGGSAVLAGAATAAELPWGFEMVTPPDKGDSAVSGYDSFRTSQDGNLFHYTMTASMAGLPAESSPMYVRYLGMRGPDRWTSKPMDPPFGAVDDTLGLTIMLTGGTSENQEHAVVGTMRALAPGAIDGGSNLYMRNTRTGAYRLIAALPDQAWLSRFRSIWGINLETKYVANDGRSALIQPSRALTDDVPPDAISPLYKWTEDEGLEVVSLLPDGSYVDGQFGADAESTTRDGIPTGDRALDRIYFQTMINFADGPVYVRAGGRTTAVSVPQLGDPDAAAAPATIHGASRDGRFAVFSSPERLTAEALPSDGVSRSLYRYDFEATGSGDRLVYLGRTRWVYQMSYGGETVVFRSNEVLAAGGVHENDNVYAWRDGTLSLVASVTPEVGIGQNLLSPNGRYWAFSALDPALAARFGADNISARCPSPATSDAGPCNVMYRYDTVSQRLSCVSCRSDGRPTRGQAGNTFPGQGANRTDRRQDQTVTDDGTVFFTSADDLLPLEDRNGAFDAYSWRDGALRLLSTGTPGTRARFLDATLDGSIVFLSTDEPISPTDTDKVADIYVTRAGAGYPHGTTVEQPPCTGVDCRGRLAAPAPAPVAASVVFAGEGNVVDDGAAPPRRGKLSAAKPKAVVGPVASLRVTVPGAGRVTVTGRGVKRVSKAAAKAGTHSVRVSLNARARRALRAGRSRAQKVKVTFTPAVGAPSSVSLSITYKAPAPTKKGR